MFAGPNTYADLFLLLFDLDSVLGNSSTTDRSLCPVDYCTSFSSTNITFPKLLATNPCYRQWSSFRNSFWKTICKLYPNCYHSIMDQLWSWHRGNRALHVTVRHHGQLSINVNVNCSTSAYASATESAPKKRQKQSNPLKKSELFDAKGVTASRLV